MDELPNNVKRLLELAKEAQTVDPALRARVRLRVDAALLGTLPASLVGTSASPDLAERALPASRHFVSPKLVLISGALLIGAGGLFWASRDDAALRLPATPVTAPVPVASHAGAAPRVEAPPTLDAQENTRLGAAPQSGRDVKASETTARARNVDGLLAAETALLDRASQALFAGEVQGARNALGVYGHRFRRPQLLLERDGLSVLADCMEHLDNAQRNAASFVRLHPATVLVRRIEQVCGLNNGE
jgi:hypothetical protein